MDYPQLKETPEEEEIDAAIKEVLDEDRKANSQYSKNCSRFCAKFGPVPGKCAVDNSSRFSLRVMEALRYLQKDEDPLPTSNLRDIVDYIEANYHSDGDLYAQVRTALKQVCSQGFALELLEDEYQLVGPVATSINIHFNDQDNCLACPRSSKPSDARRTDEWNIDVPSDEDFIENISRQKDRSSTPCNCGTLNEASPRTRSYYPTRARVSIGDRSNKNLTLLSDDRKSLKKRTKLTEKLIKHDDSFVDGKALEACPCNETSKSNGTIQYSTVLKNIHGSPYGVQSRNTSRRNGRDNGTSKGQRDGTFRSDDETESTQDSAYQALTNSNHGEPSKKRNKELKRWIKRCRHECEKRRQP